MSSSQTGYPRLWEGGEPPPAPLFGARDIALLAGFKEETSRAWISQGRLPPADGPDVNGAPTWSRELTLAWLFMRNCVPSAMWAETQTLITGPRGKELLELAAIGTL